MNTQPIAIHAEVGKHCIITDFDDGSFTQEFFNPEIKTLAPPRPVNPNAGIVAAYPGGRFSGTQHVAA